MDFDYCEDSLNKLKIKTDHLAEHLQNDKENQSSQKNICDYFKNVMETKKQQQSLIKNQLKDEDLLKKRLLQMKKELEEIRDKKEELTQEVLKTQEEIKNFKKPLKQAIKKYSENFTIDVKIKETTEEKIIATVSISDKSSVLIDVSFDKKTWAVIDINCDSLPKEVEDKLKCSPNLLMSELWKFVQKETS